MPFQTSRPGSVALLRGMEDGLRQSYPGGVEMVTDSVAPVPPEPDDFAARMSDWLAYKYGQQRFDAVVAVLNPPIPYALALRDRFWHEAPLLLVLQEEERKRFPQSLRRSAQVVTALSNTETLRSALEMFPETEHLVYLEGSSDQDRHANTLIVGNIRQAFPKLDIVEIHDLTWEETKVRVQSLPDRSIVLLGSFLFDRNHRQFTNTQQAEELSPILSVPLIADSDVAVGKGVVGGSVLSVQGAGKVAGEQLAELLKGADPDRLPVREVKNSFIVDWRQLRRWGVPLSRLPAGATILYKPPTAWEQYKRYIIATAVVLALLLALIAFLLVERGRRRKEEELNAAMLESLPGLALLVSAQGEIMRTNQADDRGVGEELAQGARRGRKYEDYLREVAGREAAAAQAIGLVIAGARASGTAEVALASGSQWLEIRAIRLPQGQKGTLVAHLDITQRKQAELERMRSRTEIYHLNRVAAMGQLAASLAHELAQPLAAILSNAEAAQRFASRENPDLTEIREALDDIAQDDRRARGVIQGMRAMLRKEDLKLEPVDLNQIASSVAQMVRNEATLRGMSIQLLLRSTPVMVKGDSIALQQVLLNLASNGLDAMSGNNGSGCLTIRTEGESNGTTATVWVDDEGPGVSDELRERLFQPFFTTKGTGLGMGLSICQSILESLGGRIDVQNRDGKGASFSVTLPRT
jgi:C4-dicarboxylate-specific signal transduction histidine kinase